MYRRDALSVRGTPQRPQSLHQHITTLMQWYLMQWYLMSCSVLCMNPIILCPAGHCVLWVRAARNFPVKKFPALSSSTTTESPHRLADCTVLHGIGMDMMNAMQS